MALHWLIALLVIGNLVGGHLVERFEDGGPSGQAMAATLMLLHMSSGVTILALTLVRIGWRLANPPPPLPAYMTPLERRLAGLVHLGFYLLLLLLPFSGWAMQSTRRCATAGAVVRRRQPAAAAAAASRALAGLFHEAHDLLGWIMVALSRFTSAPR